MLRLLCILFISLFAVNHAVELWSNIGNVFTSFSRFAYTFGDKPFENESEGKTQTVKEIKTLDDVLDQVRSIMDRFYLYDDVQEDGLTDPFAEIAESKQPEICQTVPQEQATELFDTLNAYVGDDWKQKIIEKSGINCDENMTNDGYSKVFLGTPEDDFNLGVYCWQPDAKTILHDHGDNALAFYHVVGEQSILYNHLYCKQCVDNLDDGEPMANCKISYWRSDTLKTKETAVLETDEAHIVGNFNPHGISYSIHLYVLKYTQYRCWDSLTADQEVHG